MSIGLHFLPIIIIIIFIGIPIFLSAVMSTGMCYLSLGIQCLPLVMAIEIC